ncbi:MAG: nitrite reductase small subunit NirD [Heteroscytonema crispum UTEX LB 1556]
MVQALPTRENITKWVDICALDDITPNTGVCALVENQQIAIFRYDTETEVYAIANYDPFSKTYVLSRGILGDRQSIPKVASPIYKQNFNLLTGQCFDDETVSIPIYKVRIVDNRVQVGVK